MTRSELQIHMNEIIQVFCEC